MWFDSHSNCPLCRSAVEIPTGESGSEPSSSGASEEAFKSPIGRMRSLKRMLSFDLRFHRGSSGNPDPEAPSASSVSLTRCSSR